MCAIMSAAAFLVLFPGGSSAWEEDAYISGRVTDGVNPIENTYVKIMLMMGDGIEINYSFTDSNGQYTCGVPGGLDYVVFAAHPDYYMSIQMARVAPGEVGAADFTLTPISEPKDVTIVGYVKDEYGNPRSDGHVLGLTNNPLGGDAPYYANITVPDPTGFFSVNVIPGPRGGGAIAMDFPGYPMNENGTDSPLVSGNTYWFNVTLQPRVYSDNAVVYGYVTDIDTGLPIKSAVVSIEVETGWDNYDNLTLTDASGYYSMNVQSGNARVMIQRSGYTMKILDNVWIDPGSSVRQDAQLRKTEAFIKGNVTDSTTGDPIMWARVVLLDRPDMTGNISMATTDSSGFYKLDAFVGTDLYLVAQQDGYSASYHIINVSAGEELWYDFQLTPFDSWLEGYVTDALTSAPVQWANIHLMSPGYDTWTNSDDTGHYSVQLPSGEYTVEAWHWDHKPYVANFTVIPGPNVWDFAMMPWQNAVLKGHVQDAFTGAPVVGASVWVNTGWWGNGTMTNSTGDYEMCVTDGDLYMEVHAMDYSTYSAMVHVEPLSEAYHNVSLMPWNPPTTVRLHGVVDDATTGLPIMNAMVTVRIMETGYENSTWTDPAGAYEMYVPPYELSVRCTAYSHAPYFGTIDTTGFSDYPMSVSLSPDTMSPGLTYVQSPLANISWTNPCEITAWVEEDNLRSMTLIYFMKWNGTGLRENYTLIEYKSASYDPWEMSSNLNHVRMGSNYTVYEEFNGLTSAGWLSDSTQEMYLAATSMWLGSDMVYALNGYYRNATLPTSEGAAFFNSTTGEFLGFWSFWMSMFIPAPDPTGVFEPRTVVAEFDYSVMQWPIDMNWKALGSFSATDMWFTYDERVPSGDYKSLFFVQDWGDLGNAKFTNFTVDNDPPVADAGPDQWVVENTTVTLDGRGSSDNVGIVGYEWSYFDGWQTITLHGDVVTSCFNSTGTYVVWLYVVDGANHVSADTMTVHVGPDMPPTAVAGPDQTVDEDTVVYFDGSASYDDVGIVNYTWTIPSFGVELYGAYVEYTFAEPGAYYVYLLVRDTAGQESAYSWLLVTVLDVTPPIADAGPDQFVDMGANVTFDGSGSSDNVGVVSYVWTFYDGGLQTLYGERPWYVFTDAGVYDVELNVSDAAGNWAVDTVRITVNDTEPPVADAGTDIAVNTGSTVILNGSGSHDNVGIVQYTWSFVDVVYREFYNMVSAYTFSGPGLYVVTLTVWDAAGNSDTDVVLVKVNGPPVANAGPDRRVNVGATVLFDASGTTDDFDALSNLTLEWRFTYMGNPQVLYGVNPSFQFLAPGTFTVTLYVTDSMGLGGTDTMTVVVNAPPHANAGADQLVNQGVTVTFDAGASSDDLDLLGQLNFTWTLTYSGSPVTLYGVAPSFTFSIPGTYDVLLRVTDTDGLYDTDTLVVTVNGPPEASAGSDVRVNVGTSVSFDSSATTDDLDLPSTMNYTWTFTYGGSPVTLWGAGPSFVFDTPGVYLVTLTVVDSGGLTDTDMVTVTVNGPPTAHAGSGIAVNVGATVQLNGSLSSDDLDTFSQLNLTWTFTYGGSPRVLWGATPSFVFELAGTYTVTLTVTDSDGLSDTATVVVSVNGPPTANAGPDLSVVEGTTVTLNGSASLDDGGAPALNYTWNFTYGGSAVTLWGIQPTFTFSAPGIYEITLTVRDAGGLTSTDTVTITVAAANAPPVADAGADITARVGDPVSFDGSGSTDDGGAAGLNYTWEFTYDGRTVRLYGPQPTFKFEIAGTYTVTLTVRDAGNLTDTDTVTVVVEERAESFASQYWWAIAVIVAVIVVALLAALMRKGGRKPSGERSAKGGGPSDEGKDDRGPPEDDEL